MSIDFNWTNSEDSLNIFEKFCNNTNNSIGIFDEISSIYDSSIIKVSIKGNKSSGKTSVIMHLTGQLPNNKAYPMTNQISVYTLNWPVKYINSSIHIYQLNFWDYSTTSLKYQKKECLNNMDVCLYIISVTDYKSYQYVKEQLENDIDLPLIRIVILTKTDANENYNISEHEIDLLHQLYSCQIIRIANFPITNLPFYKHKQVQKINNMICNSIPK